MMASRPIISKPFLAGDEPLPLREYEAAHAVPRADGPSRRSSTSRPSSSRGSKAQAPQQQQRSASRQSQGSSRGRKGYQFSEEVDRGLVKIVDGTDVSFDTLAQAVEEVGGPRKLWLRRRFKQITGTNNFGFLRLRNHRPSADDRKHRQVMAKELADELGLNVDDQVQTSPDFQSGFQSPVSFTRRSTEQSTRRRSHASVPSMPKAAPNGNDASTHERANAQSWAATSTVPTDYVSKGNRARALSISSITRQLENLTGNTGFYDFIRRGSIKSHLSPLFRSVRWSKGSRATSGRASFPESRPYDGTSPADRRNIVYIPDPDYQMHYHTPSPDLIASCDSRGAAAVSLLLHARLSSSSDEEARACLLNTLPSRVEERKAYVDQSDENGITPLHLAVAYGYPNVCVLLMQNGASYRAVTHRGSSVCRFAKPAQEHAGTDISLFHRILNSRQWVCAGLPPRLATESGSTSSGSGERAPPTYKRVKTNEGLPTLSTVDETTVPEPAPVPQNNFPADTQPTANSNLPPLFTSWEFVRDGGTTSNQRNSAQQHASYDFSESPTSGNLQHCLNDHSTLADLLTPDSIPQSAVSWSMDASSPESQFRIPPISQVQIPPLQPQQLDTVAFSNQPLGNGQDAFGGLQIMTSSTENGSALTSTSWADIYSADLDFPAHTTGMQPDMTSFASSDSVHSSHIPPGMTPYISNDAFTPNYMTPNVYQLGNSQPQQYHVPVTQPLYLTPPEETGWSTNQRASRNWMGWDVSRATAQALADQEFTPFPDTAAWPTSAPKRNRSDENVHLYYNGSYQ